MADIKLHGTLIRDDDTNTLKIARAIQVDGSYFVCEELPKVGTWQKGQLCYCTGTAENPVNKFYQYTGTGGENGWTESSVMNQNAFSNVKVGNTTIAADSITDTLTLVGSNVTITPNTTDDKVTFSVADGTTSAKGIVQLSSTTGSAENVAATPKGVQAAIDQTNYAGSTTPGGAANSVKASVTFNNSGSGATSGTTFDGSTAKTISYNTIGAASSSHTHTTTIAASSETNELTLAHGTKYAITAGGDSFVFTMPTDNNSHNSHKINSGLKADGTTYIEGDSSSTSLTLGDSGASSGQYGPTTNKTPAFGGFFYVPDITVNAKGIVTAINDRKITLPSDPTASLEGCSGQIKIGTTWYTVRKGTSGAAGYITFNY